MRTYKIGEAQAELSQVLDRALSGELQRVVDDSGQAVVVVSEEEWNKHAESTPTLADPLLKYAGEES